MMDLVLKQLILLTMMSFINSQLPLVEEEFITKPEKCNPSTKLLTAQCCILPPFFARDVTLKCGSMYAVINNDAVNNITYRMRHLPEGCDPWICMLNQYKFVTKDDTFDIERYYEHLDRWVELNPDFSDIMSRAKESCKELMEPFLPLELCEFKRLHFCIRRSIEVDCPVIKNTELCVRQKKFYDECREFYLRK